VDIILINQEPLSIFMLLVRDQIRKTGILVDCRFGDCVSILVGDFWLMAFEEGCVVDHQVLVCWILAHLRKLAPLEIDRPIHFVRVVMLFTDGALFVILCI